MKKTYRTLEKRLGYRFRQRQRLETALTHPSFRYEVDGVSVDNQRLEFLGDAALALVAAAHLYEQYPELREGELTKLRSRITSRPALAAIAQEADLGNYLLLGRGEQQSGGQERDSNLADALEAILGAAYLDGSVRAVRRIFETLFVPLLQTMDPAGWTDNPKGALQEYCQRQRKISPRYRITGEEGPPHSREFTVEVSLDGKAIGSGAGPNKRAAEAEAALAAMRQVTAGKFEPPDSS